MTGRLYVVPTPVGNLEDITLRALRVLKEVELVLAEDTRTSRVLFRHYDIQTHLKAYHAHNEHKVVDEIIQMLLSGSQLALISDAGTPAISDPGFLLIRACVENNIEVECLPGATAFVPALVVSGLPIDSFVYEGFLPHQKGRQKKIDRLLRYDSSVVVYESPYRVVKLLEQLMQAGAGDRNIVSVREISKKFETVMRGSVKELHEYYKLHEPKGEFVFVLEGQSSYLKRMKNDD